MWGGQETVSVVTGVVYSYRCRLCMVVGRWWTGAYKLWSCKVRVHAWFVWWKACWLYLGCVDLLRESVCSTKGTFTGCKMDGVYSVKGRYTPVSIRKFFVWRQRTSWSQAAGRGPRSTVQPKNRFCTHSPNTDNSSFACHQTWRTCCMWLLVILLSIY